VSRGITRVSAPVLLGAIVLGATVPVSMPYLATVTSVTPDVYYISAARGLDTYPGSYTAPFKTIGKCAAIVHPGQTCAVEGGTYHEMVTPVQNGAVDAPITYTVAQATDPVTITGADPITSSWLPIGVSSIYTTAVHLPVSGPQDSGFPANQLFLDGAMMPQARWPNVSSFDPYSGIALASADNSSTYYRIGSSSIPAIDWTVGGTVHYWPYARWIARTAPITSSTTGAVGFGLSSENGCPNICAAFGSPFYLEGAPAALDSAGEWVYTGTTHTLALWAPAGDSPAAHDVQAKQRQWAFDLSGRSHIIVSGFHLFAASITTTAFSSYDTIDAISATYVSHFDTIPEDASFFRPPQKGHWLDSGIIISGTHNIIENSTIAYSAGDGISLQGSYNTATNNLISDVDYSGAYGAGIRLAQVDHASVTHNTIHDAARDGISRTAEPDGSLLSSTIAYNDIYNYGRWNQDLGAIYVCCGVDGTGTAIDHNWVHDSQAAIISSANASAGLYLEDRKSVVLLHHNVGWNNTQWCILLNENTNNGVTLRGNDLVYNNSCIGGQDNSLQQNGPADSSIIRNNNFATTLTLAGGQQHILPNTQGVVAYLDSLHGDYRLAAGSVAIDAGIVVAGITDGYVGTAPDTGGYEYNAPALDWIPGCTLSGCADPFVPNRHP
jgi:parallel beta-helix repeat protein